MDAKVVVIGSLAMRTNQLGKVVVSFKNRYGGVYVPGDKAGFSPEEAERIVRLDAGVLVDPLPDEVASEVVTKAAGAREPSTEGESSAPESAPSASARKPSKSGSSKPPAA